MKLITPFKQVIICGCHLVFGTKNIQDLPSPEKLSFSTFEV